MTDEQKPEQYTGADLVTQQIFRLGEVVDVLEKRLMPLLLPKEIGALADEPFAEPVQAPPVLSVSPLREQLRGAATLLETECGRLNSIIGRVNV